MRSYGGYNLEDDGFHGHSDLTVPYSINCCGYDQIDIDVSVKRTRMDWYLIYLINGAGHYILGEDTISAKAGSVILYRPYQHQDYFYKAAEKPEIYWIHFTGNQVENLIDELGFADKNVYMVGLNSEYMEFFESIIYELQIKKANYHQLCIGYLLQLLSSFSRENSVLHNRERILGNHNIENIIRAMNENYHREYSVENYAKMCNLSISQFIRNFKKQTMYSPAKYIEKIRIAKAKELLCSSNLSIAEISSIVGYKDPYYFSKVFKKVASITPSEFRNMI